MASPRRCARFIIVDYSTVVLCRPRFAVHSCKANLGDIMTRPERFHELLEGLRKYQWYREANPEGPKQYELKLPPLGDSWEQLKVWMRAMRARGAEAA